MHVGFLCAGHLAKHVNSISPLNAGICLFQTLKSVRISCPVLSVSHSSGLGWCLKICISSKFPWILVLLATPENHCSATRVGHGLLTLLVSKPEACLG